MISYQILANKCRPQLFSNVIEQEHIISAISNSLILGRIHHAWLFFGTRGTGKTTIARLLAKSLNCKLGISSNPCRKCSNCIEIEQGNFVDLYEVDAASRTKVEDMKELLESVHYIPTKGRFKIYLIDEVHMLSRHSFNSLLKIMEEPPKHVKFILATTNLIKIPETILSRCLCFQLRPISLKKTILHISNILKKENILYEKNAITLISQQSKGSLRDAITLTEQMISCSKEHITEKIVRSTLGILHSEKILNITISILRKDKKYLASFLEHISELNINWENILIEILKLLHQISMLKIIPTMKLNNSSYYSEIVKQKIYEIAKLSNYDDIYLYYQIALLGKKELSIAPNQKIGVEMTLLRMLNLNTRPININVNKNMSII